MAKSSGGKNKDQMRRTLARLVLWALVVCFVLSGVVWSAQQVEHFLINDSRFILPPADIGQENPNLHIDGVLFANRAQIMRVFANDLGRSVYIMPLADRRKALLRLSWVKDAGVVRMWPNRIVVHIVERRPVAWVDIGTECISRYSLIDDDGVILEPPERGYRFELPILTGVRPEEKIAIRSRRVHRAEALLKDLGDLTSAVTRSDLSDIEDVKVTVRMEDRPVTLLLGDHNFHDRLQHFLDHYADIRKRGPNLKVFDLRLDDRITAAPEVKNGC